MILISIHRYVLGAQWDSKSIPFDKKVEEIHGCLIRAKQFSNRLLGLNNMNNKLI